MTKLEMVQAISAELKTGEHKLNQEEIRAVLTATEKVVDNAVLAGDNVVVLGVKFASKERKAQEKVMTVGKRAGETYTVAEAMVPTVKLLPSKKEALTKLK